MLPPISASHSEPDDVADLERHHGADQHHALDTEVEYARLLGQQLAECGQSDRNGGADGCGEREDEGGVVHAGTV